MTILAFNVFNDFITFFQLGRMDITMITLKLKKWRLRRINYLNIQK